jgi:hypothetical protein
MVKGLFNIFPQVVLPPDFFAIGADGNGMLGYVLGGFYELFVLALQFNAPGYVPGHDNGAGVGSIFALVNGAAGQFHMYGVFICMYQLDFIPAGFAFFPDLGLFKYHLKALPGGDVLKVH